MRLQGKARIWSAVQLHSSLLVNISIRQPVTIPVFILGAQKQQGYLPDFLIVFCAVPYLLLPTDRLVTTAMKAAIHEKLSILGKLLHKCFRCTNF